MRRLALTTLTFITLTFSSFSQNSIKGRILTSDGEPAASVNIEVNGKRIFTVSDDRGSYEIKGLPDGTYKITASFTGLETKDATVELQNRTVQTVDFILNENAKQLEAVIIHSRRGLNTHPVTAAKVAINPMDLPQSIAIVSMATIKDQQSQRLSEVIRNVNGVYLSTTRASTQESFAARGYGFSSSNMFKNGTRVNSGTMPEVSGLERVEVLKGSAAILYGNVAPGGIINMVTKQPKFERGGEVSLRAGSYGLIKPSIDIYGPVSKSIAFRINGIYEKADSYRDVVNSERFYINPSVAFKLQPGTELILQGDYLDHSFTPDFGTGSLADTVIAHQPRSRFLGTSWQYNKARQATASANIRHQFNSMWSINATASYQQYKRDYYSIERIQAKANGDWARPLNKIRSREDYVIGNIDITGKFNTGAISHTLLTGIDADRYHTTTYAFDNPKVYDTINILDPNKFIPRTDMPAATAITKLIAPVNRLGIYVQDLISLSSKFKVLAGLRWSLQETKSPETSYLGKDSIVKGKGASADAISPRLGLVYRPTKNMSVFASYANSFSINNGTDIYFNALPPSIIDQYELGIKNEFMKGRLSANLTFYRIINNNLAQTAPFDSAGNSNNNTALKELAGETTSDGIELDIQSQPVNGLSIIAGYSYNNMRYTKTKDVKGNYVEGKRLVNTPAHTANASVFYTFKRGKLNGLKLGASAFYTGDRWGGWNDTKGENGQAPAVSRLIAVDGFFTTDVTAGYCFRKFSIAMKVSNLFNTYNYYVHENYSINPIAPTQFISTLSVKL